MSVRFSRRSGSVAAIIGATLGAVYLSLFAYQQVDQHLFPANELKLPVVNAAIPGTDIGVDVSLPGIATQQREPWRPEDRINILVLGLDRRPGRLESDSFRSDTMFVASIDKHASRLQLLAIPRDVWAEIPYGDVPGVWAQNKINAAYSYGQFYKYPGGGAAASVAAVEQNYNIDIDHFVVIDWVGFVELIDAIGGIEIEVPAEVADFGTDSLKAFPNQTVKAGPQHMDGTQALGYSRVRVDGDLARIERQQIVIQSVARQSVSLGYIAKVPELWEAYRDAFRTDVDNALIPGFALLARQLNFEAIETFSLASAYYGAVAEDGQLVLLPIEDRVYEIIDRFFADPEIRDEAPSIAIQYPTGQDAYAKQVQEHLLVYGIPPEYIELVKTDGSGVPGIFDITGKPYTAEKLSGLFGLRLLNPEGDIPDGADVVIRLTDETELLTP